MLLSATGLALVGFFGKLGISLFSLEALMFWRYLAALPICIGFMWLAGSLHHIGSFHNPWLHFLRAFFVLGAQYSFYYYIQRDTLLNGMVLLSLGPLFIPLIEWVVTRSPMGLSTWVGLIVSFAGMICVLQPNAGIFSLLGLIGALAGLFQGCSQVIFGLNAQQERADLSVLYTFLLCTAVSLIPCLFTIDAPYEETASFLYLFLIVLGVGAASVLNQLARAAAYQHGTPSRLSTFLYFSILLGGIFDWVIFHREPNLLSLIGALLVISGGLLKIYLRTLILKRKHK